MAVTTERTLCRLYQPVSPIFTPIIDSLSVTESKTTTYTMVQVQGRNFLPNKTTYINFGSYKLPIVYYSSFNISFVVPFNALPNTYSVAAVNIYNGNFSLQVNNSYPANLNVSNTIDYNLT